MGANILMYEFETWNENMKLNPSIISAIFIPNKKILRLIFARIIEIATKTPNKK